MANEENKTKKQLWEENIRKKYPDHSFENEDDLYGASMEGYDAKNKQLEEEKAKYAADNKFVADKLSSNLDVFNFVNAIIAGESVPKAMAGLHDLFSLQEGTPEYDEYMAEMEARKERKAAKDKDIESYQANMAESAEVLKEFAEKNGVSEDTMISFIDDVVGMLRDKIFAGKFDAELVEKLYRVFNYDKDMAAAEEAGRIKGRNEKIEAKRHKEEKNDGLPKTTASSGKAEEKPKGDRDLLAESLAAINRRNSIFK